MNEQTKIGLRFYGAACARCIVVCGTDRDSSAPREQYEQAVEALRAQDATKRGVRTRARAPLRTISLHLARSRPPARSICTTRHFGPDHFDTVHFENGVITKVYHTWGNGQRLNPLLVQPGSWRG